MALSPFTARIPTAAQGTYDTTVTVISTNNGLDGYASGTAKIGPTSTYGLTGQQFAANAGAPFNATVATFTDATLSDTANDFNTTIDWGDGSPATVGTVIMTGTSMVGGATVNDFSISGSHVYATPGTESITVTLNDQHNSTSYTMSTSHCVGPRTDYAAHHVQPLSEPAIYRHRRVVLRHEYVRQREYADGHDHLGRRTHYTRHDRPRRGGPRAIRSHRDEYLHGLRKVRGQHRNRQYRQPVNDDREYGRRRLVDHRN